MDHVVGSKCSNRSSSTQILTCSFHFARLKPNHHRTGQIPYKVLKLTPFLLLSKILNGLRPELPEDLPPALRVLIERCWDVDPDVRFHIEEIQSELEWMGMQQKEELARQRAAEVGGPVHVRSGG